MKPRLDWPKRSMFDVSESKSVLLNVAELSVFKMNEVKTNLWCNVYIGGSDTLLYVWCFGCKLHFCCMLQKPICFQNKWKRIHYIWNKWIDVHVIQDMSTMYHVWTSNNIWRKHKCNDRSMIMYDLRSVVGGRVPSFTLTVHLSYPALSLRSPSLMGKYYTMGEMWHNGVKYKWCWQWSNQVPVGKRSVPTGLFQRKPWVGGWVFTPTCSP